MDMHEHLAGIINTVRIEILQLGANFPNCDGVLLEILMNHKF